MASKTVQEVIPYVQQIKCLPSFVTALPRPDLSATALALDMGGTNFRVCSVNLDKGTAEMDQEKFVITEEAKETAEGMFGFLAACVEQFVEKRGLSGELKLGFTFSFPVGWISPWLAFFRFLT